MESVRVAPDVKYFAEEKVNLTILQITGTVTVPMIPG
jgi:hypothetical protein